MTGHHGRTKCETALDVEQQLIPCENRSNRQTRKHNRLTYPRYISAVWSNEASLRPTPVFREKNKYNYTHVTCPLLCMSLSRALCQQKRFQLTQKSWTLLSGWSWDIRGFILRWRETYEGQDASAKWIPRMRDRAWVLRPYQRHLWSGPPFEPSLLPIGFYW